MNDLDLNQQIFPIIKLNYMFNGNNHTIKNLFLNTSKLETVVTYTNKTDPKTLEIYEDKQYSTVQHIGLFISSNASNYIKDLKLDNITTYLEYYEEEDIYSGLFFSESNTTFFENIQIQNSQIIIQPYNLKAYVGGLIGKANGKTEVIYSSIDMNISVLQNGNLTVIGGLVGNQDGVSNITSNKVNLNVIVTNQTQIIGGLIGQSQLIGNIHNNLVNTTVYGVENGVVNYFGGLVGSAENYQINFKNIENTINLYQITEIENLQIKQIKNMTNIHTIFKNTGGIVGKKYQWCIYNTILTTWETQNTINIVSSSNLQRCTECYLNSSNLYNVVTYQPCLSNVQLCTNRIQLIQTGIQKIENQKQCNQDQLNIQCAENAHCQQIQRGQIISMVCQCDKTYQNLDIIYRQNSCTIKEQEEAKIIDQTNYTYLVEEYQNKANQNKSFMISTIIIGSIDFMLIIAVIIYIQCIKQQMDKQQMDSISKQNESEEKQQQIQKENSSQQQQKSRKVKVKKYKTNKSFIKSLKDTDSGTKDSDSKSYLNNTIPHTLQTQIKKQQSDDQIFQTNQPDDVLSKTKNTQMIQVQDLEKRISTIDVY